MESDSGSAYKAASFQQLHFSPVPHSDGLISLRPSVPQGEKDRPHGKGALPVSVWLKDAFLLSQRNSKDKKKKKKRGSTCFHGRLKFGFNPSGLHQTQIAPRTQHLE